MNKIYKVGIIILQPPLNYKINGEYRGHLIDFWNYIKKKLERKKYKFKEIYIDNDDINWDKKIEECQKGVYDIIIGNFTVTSERYKKVNFSPPNYITEPEIIIKTDNIPELKLKNYIYFLIQNIYKTVIIIFILSIFIGFILSRINNKNMNIHIFHVMSGFFQQSGNMLNDSENNNIMYTLITLLGLIIIFVTFLFISTLVDAKTILYQKNKLYYLNNLDGKKILTPDSSISYNLIKELGGQPVIIKDIKKKKSMSITLYNYFIKNREKYDGFYSYIGSHYYKYNNKLKNMYPVKTENINVFSFPINKSNKDLLVDINYIVYEATGIEDKGKEVNFNICKKYNYIDPNYCLF